MIKNKKQQPDWEKEAQAWMDRLSMFDLEILNSIVYHKRLAVIEEIEGLIGEDAARASVLNGKLRVDTNKDSRLYNDYSTKVAYNEAKRELRQKLKQLKEGK